MLRLLPFLVPRAWSQGMGAASVRCMGATPALPASLSKQELVAKLLKAKLDSGKTFSQIGAEIGCTNIYAAGLFYNQQQLKEGTAQALAKAVPALDPALLEEMKKSPSRRFDTDLIQEPTVYRLYEAVMHNGEAIKALVNEECGDGIMSAIDIYASLDTIVASTYVTGEKRVVITMSGKFLPFVEGLIEDDVSRRK